MLEIKNSELLSKFGEGDAIISENYTMVAFELDPKDENQPVEFRVYDKGTAEHMDVNWPFKGSSPIFDGEMPEEAEHEKIDYILIGEEMYHYNSDTRNFVLQTDRRQFSQEGNDLAEVFEFEDGTFLARLWNSECESDLGYQSTVILADELFKAKLYDTGSSEEKDFIAHTYNGFFRIVTLK